MQRKGARGEDRTRAVFRGLTTPQVADACLEHGVEVRCGPSDLRAVSPAHCRFAGRVSPVRHYGSVDVFLEALERSSPGDVLVIDNGGRRDEACIGDRITLEAKNAGVAAVVIWGLHRDTRGIVTIGLPVFSLGVTPARPLRLDPREDQTFVSARVGPWTVSSDDIAIGDENGVIFVPRARGEAVAGWARALRAEELADARAMRRGTSLREQIRFSEFLAERRSNPKLTLRDYLRRVTGAIEE
jgi:4-hydroxy-4-methyl-2-oxoglutarate aldolase